MPSVDVQEMRNKAWAEVRRHLDHLYSTYYEKGETPGIFDAKRIFGELMAAWGAFRRLG